MTTTPRPAAISSMTVVIGDTVVRPQTEACDRHGDDVSLFADTGRTRMQLVGSAEQLIAYGQAIIDAATTVEQRRLAKEVVSGF